MGNGASMITSAPLFLAARAMIAIDLAARSMSEEVRVCHSRVINRLSFRPRVCSTRVGIFSQYIRQESDCFEGSAPGQHPSCVKVANLQAPAPAPNDAMPQSANAWLSPTTRRVGRELERQSPLEKHMAGNVAGTMLPFLNAHLDATIRSLP
jgi:hypothetical protein